MILYILYSEKSQIYYTGITHNLNKRLQQHNFSDGNSFTSKHRPWKIVAAFTGKNETIAAWCEQYIKQQKSSLFIEKYILPVDSKHPLMKMLRRL